MLDLHTLWANHSIPIVGLVFGALIFASAWFSSWRFDRRWGRDPK